MYQWVFAAALALAAAPAAADNLQIIGFGSLGTNDSWGDRDDRWRSAALSASLLLGPDGMRVPPAQFGQMWEARLTGEVITPEDLNNPAPDDRAYAVYLGFGLHTHLRRGATDARIGADLVFVGPQTGLDDLQTFAHRRIEGQVPPDVAQETQIDNTMRLALSGEVSRTWSIGAKSRLRPFAEARTGDEAYARVGADFIWGSFGTDSTMLRDRSTGQLYLGKADGPRGLSILVGADFASVTDSVYLPGDRAADLTATRSRARLGIHWQGERIAVQYGLTYLSPEFEQQSTSQLVGSASFRFRF